MGRRLERGCTAELGGAMTLEMIQAEIARLEAERAAEAAVGNWGLVQKIIVTMNAMNSLARAFSAEAA